MGWEQLLGIYREAAAEAELERSEPPTDCPNDGVTLKAAPDGTLFCPFDGWTPQ